MHRILFDDRSALPGLSDHQTKHSVEPHPCADEFSQSTPAAVGSAPSFFQIAWDSNRLYKTLTKPV